MELFRSEDMTYVSITMTNDSAHATVKEIGKFKLMHVVDLGASEGQAPSKEHTHYKKRLGDLQLWERKLNTLAEELTHFDIPNEGARTNVDYVPQEIKTADILTSVQQLVEPVERELNANVNFLKENRRLIAQQIERRHTLTLTKDLDLAGQARRLARRAAEAERSDPSYSALIPELSSPPPVEMDTLEEEAAPRDPNAFRNFLCGIIAVDQQPMFRRMLYRVSRGNAFARFADIAGTLEDPMTGEQQRKSVFYVMVLGQQLLQRITRMCDLFRATIYELPRTRSEFNNALAEIRSDIDDKMVINRQTEDSIVSLLTRLGNDNGTSPLRNFQVAMEEEKAMCAAMMKAHFYLTMICMEGWIPSSDLPALKNCLKAAVAGSGHPPAALEVDPSNPIKLPATTPTYFKLTPFTSAYQGIVDTYGIPRYKEVNPGLFTLVTFPFLFGVMYGDIFHGMFLFLAALAMIKWEAPLLAKQKAGTLGEIPSMAFGGRYVLVLMGFFAVYAGIIYNDFAAIPLNVYGSAWVDAPDANRTGRMINPTGWTYPCGVDPAWMHKTNELAFFNSLKMKMAVIFGVVHMLFGIVLSLFNHMYYKDRISAIYDFIPKMVFMCCTFGYMSWMILYKWCQDWTTRPHSPPNLIQTMIAMFLSPGNVEEDKQLYEGQAGFQVFLLLCAFISVPIMLLAKPYKNKWKREKEEALRKGLVSQSAQHDVFSDLDERKEASPVLHAPHDSHQVHEEGHEEHSFSDELIHSAIHTIEFVLGAVSNTASYLRDRKSVV